MRGVILCSLAYYDSRNEAENHGEGKLPPVLETEEIEYAERNDGYEPCTEVGTAAEGSEELLKSGPFLGADRINSENREEYTDGGDAHRSEYRPGLGINITEECGSAESHGREYGTAV